VTVVARWAETARAADGSQAAYFSRTLADEREMVTAKLTEARDRLHALTDGQQVLGLRGMARARFKVRELERQIHALNRMIGALDRRYSAMWSRWAESEPGRLP